MAQTVLITGVSRGVGREMARQAVARGDRVYGTVRRAGSAPDGVTELVTDVTSEADLATAVASIAGGIDLLVCNAGIYRGRGALDAEDAGAEAWADVLMTNVAGPFLTVRAALDRMVAPGGKIAIISSKMGSSARAPGNAYLYRSSKAAATNLACNLASELKPRGIWVGAYHPGWVRTDMGGDSADLSVEESAAGLLARFDVLSAETTGTVEDYAGVAVPL